MFPFFSRLTILFKLSISPVAALTSFGFPKSLSVKFGLVYPCLLGPGFNISPDFKSSNTEWVCLMGVAGVGFHLCYCKISGYGAFAAMTGSVGTFPANSRFGFVLFCVTESLIEELVRAFVVGYDFHFGV